MMVRHSGVRYLAFGALLVVWPLAAAQQAARSDLVQRPFESVNWGTPGNRIDELVTARLDQSNIQGAFPTSDEVFLRRIHIDLLGSLPDLHEIRRFTGGRGTDKRAQVIEALMARPEFAEYYAMRWCDVLRVKSEFPINLWPNAVQAYHRWIKDQLQANRPIDQMARDMICSSGSNFRNPPVNFYRAVQGREPAALAGVVALTFMCSRLDTWPAPRRAGMTSFFSRVKYKKTGEWKEEIVCNDPAPTGVMPCICPDGTMVVVPPNGDPRDSFANWLLSPRNPWFAKAMVNRVWYWLIGRGIVHEPDDMRPDNPPANPELMDYLAAELIASNYDLRHIYRLILNSRTYQQSSIPRSRDPKAESLFAYYIVRRLDAEVLADALRWITGGGETYSSDIPEPFTYIPKDTRTVALPDGSITSAFLQMFGRPPRDTGLESERNLQPSDAQRLYMLNSRDMHRRLEAFPRLRWLVESTRNNTRDLVRGIYQTILSREPTAVEQAEAETYFKKSGLVLYQAAVDLVWALLNTKEFNYRH